MEISFEILGISNIVVFAGHDIIQSFTLFVALEGRLVELIIDGLVLFVVN